MNFSVFISIREQHVKIAIWVLLVFCFQYLYESEMLGFGLGGKLFFSPSVLVEFFFLNLFGLGLFQFCIFGWDYFIRNGSLLYRGSQLFFEISR